MKEEELVERANNKIAGNIMELEFRLKDYDKMFHQGLDDKIEICISSTKKEIEVWNYISEKINN